MSSAFSAKAVVHAKNVTVEAGDQLVNLEYTPPAPLLKSGEIVSWHVYRSPGREGPFKRISLENPMPVYVSAGGKAGEPKLSFTDRFLENGTTYYYRVCLINVAGVESKPSETYSATPVRSASVVPLSQFDVYALTSRAMVSWNSNVEEGTYQVFARDSKSDKPFTAIHSGSLLSGEGNWFDNQYVPGTEKYYFLEVRLPDNSKWRTDTLNILTIDQVPPNPPANVSAEIIDSNRVKITWSPSLDRDIIGYDIERRSSKDDHDGVKLNARIIENLFYIDTLRENGYGAYYLFRSRCGCFIKPARFKIGRSHISR